MKVSKLTTRPRRLRQEPTIAERMLWERLRNHKLNNWGFRRQAPLEGFVVNCLCHAPALVVEIDGPPHDDGEQQAFDRQRDALLEAAGYAVLRVKQRAARLYIELVEAKITDVGMALLDGRALSKSELRFDRSPHP